MKVHKVSLADLFSNRKRYVVPLFQRAYVWSRDRQWQPLWQDVVDRAEAVIRAAPKRIGKMNPFLPRIGKMNPFLPHPRT